MEKVSMLSLFFVLLGMSLANGTGDRVHNGTIYSNGSKLRMNNNNEKLRLSAFVLFC